MYFALARRGALRHGETVLVLGSAAASAPPRTDRQGAGRPGDRDGAPPGGAEFVESLGADVVLPLTDGWLQAVKDHTGGRGVDLVVDPIGGDAFDDAIRALATEGRLLVIGFARRRHPDRQSEPTAAAQRQRHRRGLRRVRQPHPGVQSLFEFGVAELVGQA